MKTRAEAKMKSFLLVVSFAVIGWSCVACELAVRDEILYWVGGQPNNFSESRAFCESVSNGLMPIMWNNEMRVLQYSLQLPRDGEEFWVGAKLEDGKFVWSEGSRIEEYLFEAENKCDFPTCGLTVQNSKNHGIRFTVRNGDNKYRNLCRLYTKSETALPRLAQLWRHLGPEEQITLTKELPSQMIRVNSQRVQELEDSLKTLTEKVLSLSN